MAQVLDYSAGFPGAVNIQRAGYDGAVRYIGFPNRRKCTTAGELNDFAQHGLGMALVYQDGTGDWLGGYGGGQSAARRAREHANVIGFPADRPIYFAVDRDIVTEVNFRTVTEYLRGASTVLGGPGFTGVYGEHDVTTRARNTGVVHWWWQTRAWSGGQVDPQRHLYQQVGTVHVGGIAADVNDVLKSDWGQHSEAGMISEEDLDRIAKRIFWDTRFATLPDGATVNYAQVMHEVWHSMQTVLRLVSQSANITPQQIADALEPGLRTAILPVVEKAVRDSVGNGETDIADAIVHKIGVELASAAAPYLDEKAS